MSDTIKKTFKEVRNLDFHRLLPLVDVRPEYVVICEMNYAAAFLLRAFERRHLTLYDAYVIDSQKHESYKTAVKQKWTTQSIVKELGAVYRARGIPSALKYLHRKGFIIHEYAMQGRAYVGHDIYLNVAAVQAEIDLKFPVVQVLVGSAMGTDKVFEHPKRGRPVGSKTVNRKSDKQPIN